MACLGLSKLSLLVAVSAAGRSGIPASLPSPTDALEIRRSIYGVWRVDGCHLRLAPAYSDVAGVAVTDAGYVFAAGWSWGTFRRHSEVASADGVLNMEPNEVLEESSPGVDMHR